MNRDLTLCFNGSRRYLSMIVVGILLFFVSCTPTNVSEHLQDALEQAGINRLELEKVLARYDVEDSLKYRAACFLIENMPWYSYYEGELLDDYLDYFRMLSESESRTSVAYQDIANEITNRYGHFSYDRLQQKQDILTLDSAYICNNIDWAFKVWREQPWGKNISFEDFCEYILPYRIGDEKPEYWREKFYTEYNPLLEELRYENPEMAEDPIQALFVLMRHITNREEVYFTTIAPGDLPHVGASVARYKSGSCKDLTDYVVYVCRALGIPCHIDFVPIRGNDNVGHFWLSFKDKNGELYAQDFPESVVPVRTSGFRNDPKVKVYRYTFSYNREMKKEMTALDTNFPELFDRLMFTDVTYPYAKHYASQVFIPLEYVYNQKVKNKIAYLCTAQYLDWTPVAWAPRNKNDITFNNIQKGDIMRIAIWENNRLVPQSDPFRINPLTNQIIKYARSESVQDVKLYTKYSTSEESSFLIRMLGGVFEGSNDAGFSRKDTLFVINNMSNRLLTQVYPKNQKKYRYVRYYGPPGSHCNISEVTLYEAKQDTIYLDGAIIGTPGSLNKKDPHEYTNVFDQKTWTSFDYKEPSGGWAGLDLGTAKNIAKITYSPRNRDNYIRPGDTFELFYLDGEWKSFGVVKSESDSLLYKNVPTNTLLYLKNHSRGKQERIFTYENGKQIW